MSESLAEQLEQTSPELRLVEQEQPSLEVQEAILKLSNVDREILRLKFQQNLSYAESAKSLGVGVKSIAKSTHSAIRKLRHVMAEGSLEKYEVTTSSRRFDKNHPKFTAYALRELSNDDYQKAKDYLTRHHELQAEIEAIRSMAKSVVEELEINPLPKLSRGVRNPLPQFKALLTKQVQDHPQMMIGVALMLVVMLMAISYRIGQKTQEMEEANSRPLAATTAKSVAKASEPAEEAVEESQQTVAESKPAPEAHNQSAKPVAQVAVPVASAPKQPIAVRAAVAAKPMTQPIKSNSVVQNVPRAVPAVQQQQQPVARTVPVVKTPAPEQVATIDARSVAPVPPAEKMQTVPMPVASQKPTHTEPAAPQTPKTPAANQSVGVKEKESTVSVSPALASKPKVETKTAPSSAKSAGVDLSKLGASMLGASNKETAVAYNFKARASQTANASSASESSGVRLENPTVNGGLTSEDVLAALRAKVSDPQKCYDELIKRSPNAKGKVVVDFTILGDGRVRNAVVKESTIEDGLLRGCMTSKMRSWKFPNPKAGENVKVQSSFVFGPN